MLELKEKIAESLSVPAAQQRLIYKGRVLKDELTLESYDVQDGHTVHMVKGAAAAATSNASNASSTPATSSSTNSTTQPIPAPAPTSNPMANPMANPFANPFSPFGNANNGLGGMGMFGNNNAPPDVNRLQEQLLHNPDAMQQIMNSPMMDNLLNNPDLLRNMMLNNPQMQAMLDSNPQIRHILNDPAVSHFSFGC